MFWRKIKNQITASTRPEKSITLLLHQRDDLSTILESGVREAAKAAGYTLFSIDCKNSVRLQLEHIEQAKRRGEKEIIINLVNPVDISSIIEATMGMKVVLLNHIPRDINKLNENVIFVGPNDLSVGRLQGEWLVNYFKEKGNTNIRYVLLEGITEWPTTIMRNQAVRQAFIDGGLNATLAASPIVADYEQSIAKRKMMPFLGSGIAFDAIISNNDSMALGALEAFDELGLDPSRAPIVSVNATPRTVEAVLSGRIAMTVFQNVRAQGTVAITAINNMLTGKPINEGTNFTISAENPYLVYVPLEPLTKEHIPTELNISTA